MFVNNSMNYKQKLEEIEKEYNKKLIKAKQSEQDPTILFFELKTLRKFYNKKMMVKTKGNKKN